MLFQKLLCLSVTLLFLTNLASAESDSSDGVVETICVLQEESGSGVSGTITLTSDGKAKSRKGVTISGEMSGLSEGLHGFHIHEFGDLSGGCSSAGGHYNPFEANHGAPDVEERHVGDLGNIEADSGGIASFTFDDDQVDLSLVYVFLSSLLDEVH